MFLVLFSYVLNKLDPSILVWERDTLRFSCEYSYSSLISIEYSCLATSMLLALVFYASLVRVVSSLMLESTLLFHG